MRVVYKYELPITKKKFKLYLPAFFQVLSLQVQNGLPQLWILQDTRNKKSDVEFSIYGTGTEVDEKDSINNYIGTIQHEGYVWHLFMDSYNVKDLHF